MRKNNQEIEKKRGVIRDENRINYKNNRKETREIETEKSRVERETCNKVRQDYKKRKKQKEKKQKPPGFLTLNPEYFVFSILYCTYIKLLHGVFFLHKNLLSIYDNL